MGKYVGPKCKLSRREGTDLFLTSNVRPLGSKCKEGTVPGQHGQRKSRLSVYGTQHRAKQLIKRTYSVRERQFRTYYKHAAKRKGSTGEILLTYLESRLDNVVYRCGFSSTRAEARQLVSHNSILVNGEKVNIASFQVSPGDTISIREKSRNQVRIIAALELSEQRKKCEWLEVDHKGMSAVYKTYPDRSDLSQEYQEQLVVELYSK